MNTKIQLDPSNTCIRSTDRIIQAIKRGDDSYGKPLDCVGVPLQAQLGKHDFIKLTPAEAMDKQLTLEDGEPPIAHIGHKYVDPNDWTKTKRDVVVPVYTELEAQLLASLRQTRDLLVQIRLKDDAGHNCTDYIQKALKQTVDILSEHEVPS